MFTDMCGRVTRSQRGDPVSGSAAVFWRLLGKGGTGGTTPRGEGGACRSPASPLLASERT